MPSKRFIELTSFNDNKTVVNMDYILHISPDVGGGPTGGKITFTDGKTALVKDSMYDILNHGNS
jgi:uncharacterized protein YlzI (FlbEa/FlbD family)